ncbi:hypothetical protein CEE45_15280 [Candidatus Heimdallarchaeota archaeon B3_Heim]|nr:MAG: hypothetical protein CEE45_15280 [Candidatus Heimdallarchaeota archaeon B3_Heim]
MIHKKSNLKLVSFCIFVLTIMMFSPVIAIADQTPIVPVDDVEDTYSPVSYGDWDYYTLPPGTSYSDVFYTGGGGLDGSAEFTEISSDRNFFDLNDRPLTKDDYIGSWALRGDSRDSSHIFFDNTLYPRAVRIESNKDADFLKSQKSLLSLHEDYSSTFFAEKDVDYKGYFDSNDSFFLDVTLGNSKADADIEFYFNYPLGGYTAGVPESKMTYPFIPMMDGVQQFTITANDSTLVTLTPHEWKFPSWMPNLELNSIFSEEFDQGDPWSKDENTDELVKPDNEMFSLRMFNISVEKDQYYRINTIFEMDEVKPGVLSSQPFTFLIGDYYQILGGGTLDGDGLVIRATEAEGITLVMYSPGEAHGSYSIFFQEISQFALEDQEPLPLNENFAPETNVYYEFTLSSPTAVRFNSSNPSFDYDVYVEGNPGQWLYKTNEVFFGAGPNDWTYLPSGKYAIVFSNFVIEDKMRVNLVEVQSPDVVPFSINQDSILAIELPLTRNRLNFVNISTTDHINQSITYSYTIFNKYRDLGYSPFTTSTSLGNRQLNGVWDDWPSNNTRIASYLPSRDYDAPILVVAPTSALNGSGVSVSTFAGTLRISSNEAVDQSYQDLTFSSLSTAFSSTGFYGNFIPTSTISQTTDFAINDDQTTSNYQIYGVPLDLDPNSIYNVSVYLIGNYSTSNSLNATFYNDIHAHGGNLRDLDIFELLIDDSDEEQAWQSFLILTVSDVTYLYINLLRDSGYNSTLQISISKLSATAMNFQLNQEYNETVSDNEVKQTSLVVKKITPAEMKKSAPGFEMAIVLFSTIGLSIFMSRRRRKMK